jgi:murein DD-endopeptidase MepM/ murein hydrolase activator NlpD
VRAPFAREGVFGAVAAEAWRFRVRRGQRIVVDVTYPHREVFVDLFVVEGPTSIASAARGSSRLQYDATDDADLILRVQPELDHAGAFRVVTRLEASLHFPVQGGDARAVQSTFGGPRDGGRRQHAGVDIFAPRGTPVFAAADGWVTGSTTNALGGNVVWLWSPSRRLTTYYAHLDRHEVSPGRRVRAGDTVGYVGTTGNARGTPPHLHFGVYGWQAGAVDPLPYLRGGDPELARK